MMTEIEAKALVEWFEVRKGKTLKLNDKGIDLVIEALEKQIPKKPLTEYHCVLQRLCPSCGCEVSDIEDRKWSCNCGQKLDWE